MRRVIFAALSTIAGLVMLLSFKSRSTPTAMVRSTGSTGNLNPSTTDAGPATGASAPSTTANAAGTSGTKTETGVAADTRYGPVQVRITVTDGRVTGVEAVEYPQETRRDEEINAYAIPELNQEATAARSADIDMITGATYTSDGYIASLQSALNEAGLR